MKSIAVLGLGKVGRLAAQLLVDSEFEVIGVDSAANPKNFLHEVAAIDVTDRASIILTSLKTSRRPIISANWRKARKV